MTCGDIGGAEGTRTPDPLVANEVRYQLRHSPLVETHEVIKRPRPPTEARPMHRNRAVLPTVKGKWAAVSR